MLNNKRYSGALVSDVYVRLLPQVRHVVGRYRLTGHFNARQDGLESDEERLEAYEANVALMPDDVIEAFLHFLDSDGARTYYQTFKSRSIRARLAYLREIIGNSVYLSPSLDDVPTHKMARVFDCLLQSDDVQDIYKTIIDPRSDEARFIAAGKRA